MSNAELQALLSHPDAFVRAMADWALQARRPVRSGMPDNGIASYRIEDNLTSRLAALEARCIAASDQYFLEPLVDHAVETGNCDCAPQCQQAAADRA